MTPQPTTTQITPALRALHKLRAEVKQRVGKEGGNLNERMLGYIDTVESTLMQIEPLGNMLKIINQQSEVAVHTFRVLNASHAIGSGDVANGDDGTSDTKGK